MNEIMGISRLRIGTDGKGITTLIAFYGCPLRCTYCLNPQCNNTSTVRAKYTTEELLNIVKVDDIYFQMTDGGITFGGGGPLMNSDFIARFCKIANPAWKIRIETCLNVPWKDIETLIDLISLWIIDIKDMNEEIYKNYTGIGNCQMIRNPEKLRNLVSQDKIIIRVPLINGYNTEKDVEMSIQRLRDFENIDRLTYVI